MISVTVAVPPRPAPIPGDESQARSKPCDHCGKAVARMYKNIGGKTFRVCDTCYYLPAAYFRVH